MPGDNGCKQGKCTTDKGSVVPAGMMGAANMDAGGEQYRAHLLKSVEIVLQKLPHSAGLTFDGTGWFGGVNTLADDGRTFIEAYSAETGVPNAWSRPRKAGKRQTLVLGHRWKPADFARDCGARPGDVAA